MFEGQKYMDYSQQHLSNIDLEAYHNVIRHVMLESKAERVIWCITDSCLLKVDHKNTRTNCEICSKLTMTTPRGCRQLTFVPINGQLVVAS